MSEFGDIDGAPSEDLGNVSEAASEQASQGFAASQAAAKAQQQEEKKAKKRDTGVADIILQFLSDTQKTHLATLISRLVARDCPSTFILAVLSLVSEGAKKSAMEYVGTENDPSDASALAETVAQAELSAEANTAMSSWVILMDSVLQKDHTAIISALMVDDQNIDGTILQLTTFVLQDFLRMNNKEVEFDQLQLVASGILQTLFEPYMHAHIARLEMEKPTEEE